MLAVFGHVAGDGLPGVGLVSGQGPAGEAEVHRLGLADRAGEALGSADARDDTELDL
jgi:hypothetical protein